MDSDSKKSPRPRFRFRFSGKSKQAKDAKVSANDILESLTRQDQPHDGIGEEKRIGFEEPVAQEDASEFQGPGTVPTVSPRTGTKRSSAGIAFTLMFLGGFFVVWLYGSVTKAYDLSSFVRLIPNSGVQTVFGDPTQIGIIIAGALLTALWIARRRKSSSLHSLSV